MKCVAREIIYEVAENRKDFCSWMIYFVSVREKILRIQEFEAFPDFHIHRLLCFFK